MSMLRFRLQLLTSRARLCQDISWIQFAINFIHPQDTMPNRIFDVCLHRQKPHDLCTIRFFVHNLLTGIGPGLEVYRLNN